MRDVFRSALSVWAHGRVGVSVLVCRRMGDFSSEAATHASLGGQRSPRKNVKNRDPALKARDNAGVALLAAVNKANRGNVL
jgi:hypothetical protein